MRAYFASFAFVTALLTGYTVLVLKNQPVAKSEAPRASADAEHRQPAAAPETAQAAIGTSSVD